MLTQALSAAQGPEEAAGRGTGADGEHRPGSPTDRRAEGDTTERDPVDGHVGQASGGRNDAAIRGVFGCDQSDDPYPGTQPRQDLGTAPHASGSGGYAQGIPHLGPDRDTDPPEEPGGVHVRMQGAHQEGAPRLEHVHAGRGGAGPGASSRQASGQVRDHSPLEVHHEAEEVVRAAGPAAGHAGPLHGTPYPSVGGSAGGAGSAAASALAGCSCSSVTATSSDARMMASAASSPMSRTDATS